MNELFFILEQCFNTINEDNGKAFASDVFAILSNTKKPEEQGKKLAAEKQRRLKFAKQKADYIDEGTPEAFATNFINKLKALKYPNLEDEKDELFNFAKSYYNLATKAALTQNANTLQRTKSMAAGNGAGSKIKHIPASEGDLEKARKPQIKQSASVDTENEYIDKQLKFKFNY